MNNKFEVLFLEEALNFIQTLDKKTRIKIYYNIDKAKAVNDPKLFKKLTEEIWEFRTNFGGRQYPLFAFWDKTVRTETFVIATHGMIKKMDKIPRSEITRAIKIRTTYFED